MMLEAKTFYPKIYKSILGLLVPLALTSLGIFLILHEKTSLGWMVTIFFWRRSSDSLYKYTT
jgi:hypothetical protein